LRPTSEARRGVTSFHNRCQIRFQALDGSAENGFKTFTPVLRKSRVLRVTTVN
jgi:hypothetical protein